MRKAVADAAKTTASPREAIEALPKLPSATPPIDARPTFRPWLKVRVTRKITAGPGVIAKMRLAKTNMAKVGDMGC
jgi:hypothetical protein